ncbi:MAG: DNA-formamidopyrimidine glycosylase, partial [Rickettsiaceae bacterium]|nr:DNA-formamidopyrimidine glycosylase [Rickettsiaceae bacterium]
MPELPEVETVKTYLKKQILGKKILSCMLLRQNLRYNLDLNLTTITKNTIIKDVARIAKYLVISLDNDYAIIIHLGMSGRFTLVSSGYQLQKH